MIKCRPDDQLESTLQCCCWLGGWFVSLSNMLLQFVCVSGVTLYGVTLCSQHIFLCSKLLLLAVSYQHWHVGQGTHMTLF